MNMQQAQDAIINEFAEHGDWFEKYEHLIGLGREMPSQGEELKREENRISGCQSEVWLTAELRDGRVRILADSDAMITRGIIALLLRVLNDRSPEEIVEADLYFLEKIGLKSHLSPARSNGLAAVVSGIRSRAEKLMDRLPPNVSDDGNGGTAD
jgi:cysteine desulfuration protein SufE